MISFLKKLIVDNNLNIEIKNIDTEKDIIKKIETNLVLLDDFIKVSNIMTKIWTKQRDNELLIIKQDLNFQKKLQDILSLGLDHDENFLTCFKFIPISVVKINNNIHILNENQVLKIIDLGFGIIKFYIEKNDFIKDVYCEGYHPNINPFSNKFCFDFEHTEFSKLAIENIYEQLGYANLTFSYLCKNEIEKIGEIVNEKK